MPNLTQTITINNKSFLVDPAGKSDFWTAVNSGVWEPETYSIFDKYIDDTTLAIDIGAWIGPTALYTAQISKKCVAFEPDPIAFPALKKNVDLNSSASWSNNLTIAEKAVSNKSGKIAFGSEGTGGDSMSSVLFSGSETSWSVDAVTLESVVKEHAEDNQKIFMKLDIEGGEYSLIPEISEFLANPNVTAYISLHPQFLRHTIKNSAGKILGVPRFLKTSLEYLKMYKALLNSLPKNKKVTFDEKEYKTYFWFLAHAFIRLRTPKDLLVRSI